MPSQSKKKDNVSKNMGGRYAPIEGSLRSTPHTITLDLSGSMNYAPSGPIFGQASEQPKRAFFNPEMLKNCDPTKSIFYKSPVSQDEASPSGASETSGTPESAAKLVEMKESEHPIPSAPPSEDDSGMDWEPAAGPN